MHNRQPTKPGRVLITPEDGTAPFYATVTRADEPTEPGTPYNKATQLSDETSALLGGAETVNEAFRHIADITLPTVTFVTDAGASITIEKRETKITGMPHLHLRQQRGCHGKEELAGVQGHCEGISGRDERL